MVVVLAVLSIEGGKVDEWYINSDEREEEIEQGTSWREATLDDRGIGYRRSLIGKRRGGSDGLQIIVVDLAGVGVSHHSFITRDVWSGLRVMVAGDEGLEWISTNRVLTICLFVVRCFCHSLQLTTDVDRGEFGSFLVS
ncbi:hypothetical protein PVK06_011138 [Gossypium arboreum]|uniref:Uncharacterized protein n=1 Tax=Gossypium arboreum TaxID=29729 RepID=A0ABR0Q816_GOSAR|nr:hypothetical protein PVK06_011138 [Gossypium arboreum]